MDVIFNRTINEKDAEIRSLKEVIAEIEGDGYSNDGLTRSSSFRSFNADNSRMASFIGDALSKLKEIQSLYRQRLYEQDQKCHSLQVLNERFKNKMIEMTIAQQMEIQDLNQEFRRKLKADKGNKSDLEHHGVEEKAEELDTEQ